MLFVPTRNNAVMLIMVGKKACPPYENVSKINNINHVPLPPRQNSGATYFFTVVTYRRQTILCDDAVRNALRVAIVDVRDKRPFTVDAWVLLPDHLHCLWTLPPGDADYAARWSLIKRSVSISCGTAYRRNDWLTASKTKHRESTLWQRRHWEHQIRGDRDFEKHCDYIHWNPVKHGLVARAVDYTYTSFHRFVRLGIYPPHWAGATEDLDDGE